MVDSLISLEGSDRADPEMKLLALLQTEVSEHPSTVRKPLPDLQLHKHVSVPKPPAADLSTLSLESGWS